MSTGPMTPKTGPIQYKAKNCLVVPSLEREGDLYDTLDGRNVVMMTEKAIDNIVNLQSPFEAILELFPSCMLPVSRVSI